MLHGTAVQRGEERCWVQMEVSGRSLGAEGCCRGGRLVGGGGGQGWHASFGGVLGPPWRAARTGTDGVHARELLQRCGLVEQEQRVECGAVDMARRCFEVASASSTR